MLIELQELVSEAKMEVSPSIEDPKFSPAEKLKLGAVDFPTLNDAGHLIELNSCSQES